MRTQKAYPSIHSGMFADISFLLLIFFMVVTSFNQKRKIEMVIPPKMDDAKPYLVSSEKVLDIFLNDQGEILAENKLIKKNDLFTLLGPIRDITSNNTIGIIKLNLSANALYEDYLLILDMLQKNKRELWSEYAQQFYGNEFSHLTNNQKKHITKQVKYSIIESEIPMQ